MWNSFDSEDMIFRCTFGKCVSIMNINSSGRESMPSLLLFSMSSIMLGIILKIIRIDFKIRGMHLSHGAQKSILNPKMIIDS